MESRKYHNIRRSRAGNEIWEFVKKQKIYEIAIISIGTIVNGGSVVYKYYDILMALLYEIGVLIITFGFLFLWKSLRTVPERIYEEEQKNIELLEKENLSLKEQLRPKLEVTFKQGVRPWFQGESGYIHTHRIGIINPGAETVQKVTVQLIDIEPYPNDCNFTMPFCLRFTNESPTLESKDLQTSKNPNESLFVDVFRNDFDSNSNIIIMEICNTVDTKPECTFYGFIVPKQSYKITIKVNSNNGGEPITKRFRFDPEKEDVKDFMEMD